jgi:hypothetical protein
MLRLLNLLFLTLTLALTSVAVAFAHGQRTDQGADLVICSGAELITITIGPDGVPIKKIQVCPDAVSVFVASFTPPVMPRCSSRVVARLSGPRVLWQQGQKPVSPSARGPPLGV